MNRKCGIESVVFTRANAEMQALRFAHVLHLRMMMGICHLLLREEGVVMKIC